ncbi:hypothetical protein ASF27_07660 [Methylobacterium sp. Leaf102]|uniref:GNAT family N-acetyltransferase n=1 Tax=Methylobacterium sp. Leaf102 TaxID=1736253 RepID=UPI0006F3537D|nr:GNAT family N-acetyltransferase [Methylobacterium sp. Leaf102]KQP28447.1 hypothetical protein ASF27_07660 [Methylobacterium sp. Leaf102]
MRIRPFQPEDAPALAALFHASVHAIAARHYGFAQCFAWSPAPPEPGRYIAQGSDGRTFLVAVDDRDVPIAYGDLEADGHLDHLYCRPDKTGMGVASALYDALERVAHEQRMTRLFVEASETARIFYTHKGFKVEACCAAHIRGVRLHNYRMVKALGSPYPGVA